MTVMRPNGEQNPLIVETHGGMVAVLRFNRPHVRNAVNVELARALGAAVAEVERDERIKVAILTSSTDGMFCAGGDLSVVREGRARELRLGEDGFAGFVDAIRTKPWIAAVDGPALGGGFELCLACDMIVASDRSRFGLPEVRWGLIAGAGGAHRLARRLPRNIAVEMLTTGEPLDAKAAAAFGFVNRIVAHGEVVEMALAIAERIAANAPLAVRESLALARAGEDLSDAELRRLSRERMAFIQASADAAEGPLAFTEGRLPRWTGR